ncbi:Glycosylphosphatidylinositol (GPI) anchor assembly protein [Ophidiomyces ophidiicola]|nr:Glycosylphosphatidylinositol (GPI) anchor assembly protein [Ophidiomyces ophidiicola]KAI1927470.1 Glycosylphosphatidylinositol (GPI) anchor assembly protein [Ophidiomyces ophidiicola]KAI2023457.1 Glycosylphosphatidylinositol (GPI) anchor assembly protein [Ophidiomyces ophidiicola]KAI2096600.1 Glycosylphosphatidylinositol (GPI) anchor assembly protein [Ophidiomyces ophidiicola]KAI2124598.1 Glycosylphosphatidylinositol (GPI) anchor assembly protein [Ophidiomyces ophidiicola]
MDVPVSTLSPSATPSRKPPPSCSQPPVSIQRSSAAQILSHLHPLVVLSLFTARFQLLVDDPVSALASLLPVICAVQGIYVVVCLPTAKKVGSGKDKGRAGQKRRIGATGGGENENALGANVVPAILSLLLPILLGTPCITILLVLFGAPATTHVFHTILCATHMSVLAGTSLVYVHGTDGSVWREIWGASRAIDSIWAAAVGTAVGAWLGAVPIPLDWDRPWQAYPITIVTGAYIGYALGSLLGRTPLLFGKRIQFDSEEDSRPKI